MIEREKKRQALVDKYADQRAALKETARDESLPMEERFKARLKLAKLPRNSSFRNCISSSKYQWAGQMIISINS
jgi:hypothetical protein